MSTHAFHWMRGIQPGLEVGHWQLDENQVYSVMYVCLAVLYEWKNFLISHLIYQVICTTFTLCTYIMLICSKEFIIIITLRYAEECSSLRNFLRGLCESSSVSDTSISSSPPANKFSSSSTVFISYNNPTKALSFCKGVSALLYNKLHVKYRL